MNSKLFNCPCPHTNTASTRNGHMDRQKKEMQACRRGGIAGGKEKKQMGKRPRLPENQPRGCRGTDLGRLHRSATGRHLALIVLFYRHSSVKPPIAQLQRALAERGSCDFDLSMLFSPRWEETPRKQRAVKGDAPLIGCEREKREVAGWMEQRWRGLDGGKK